MRLDSSAFMTKPLPAGVNAAEAVQHRGRQGITAKPWPLAAGEMLAQARRLVTSRSSNSGGFASIKSLQLMQAKTCRSALIF